jgi:anti-sigma B factor antagonist
MDGSGRLGSGQPFRVWTEPEGDTLVVAAAGELDVASAGEFEDEVKRAIASDAGVVTVNLSAVEFIDSTGLRVLLETAELSSQSGTRLGIVREFPPAVERTLEVSGLADRLPFID